MKFKDGYMISSGQPVKDYIDSAVRNVLLRQVCFFFFFLHSHLIDFLSALGFSCCWLIFFLLIEGQGQSDVDNITWRVFSSVWN